MGEDYQEKFDRIFRQMLAKLDQPLTNSEVMLQRINEELVVDTSTIAAPVSNAKTEQAQLIHNTVSKAERIRNNLLAIERLLEHRKLQQGVAASPSRFASSPSTSASTSSPGPGIPALQPSPSLQKLLTPEDSPLRQSPALYAAMAGSALPSSYPMPQQQPLPPSAAMASAVAMRAQNPGGEIPLYDDVFRKPSLLHGDSYDFMATDKLSVPYTQMGIQTTVPDQTALAKKDVPRPDSQWDQILKGKAEVVPWNARLPITLSVVLPKSRYWCGDKVIMDVEIYNQTPKQIKKMTVTLLKRSCSYAITKEGDRKLSSRNEEAVHEMMVIPHGFPVKPRFRYNHKVNFKIPFTVDPAVVDPSSSFEILYFLKITTGVPRHHGPAVVLGPLKLEPRAV